jgi:S-phase kinase-associated protein 1
MSEQVDQVERKTTEFEPTISRDDERNITLVSQDGERYEVPFKHFAISRFVSDAVADSEEDDLDDLNVVNVKGEFLAQVNEFCAHYFEDPMIPIPRPLPWPRRVPDVVQRWYGKFITRMNHMTMFEVLLAANYLNIPPLVQLCAARIARITILRSPEQIAEYFGCDEPWTDEQREELLQQEVADGEPRPTKHWEQPEPQFYIDAVLNDEPLFLYEPCADLEPTAFEPSPELLADQAKYGELRPYPYELEEQAAATDGEEKDS